jgi:hypothetical protein
MVMDLFMAVEKVDPLLLA